MKSFGARGEKRSQSLSNVCCLIVANRKVVRAYLPVDEEELMEWRHNLIKILPVTQYLCPQTGWHTDTRLAILTSDIEENEAGRKMSK